jgi:hypothetical protein
MQPGLTRAVPMGIVGFLVGALLVIILRSLQSLDPVWAVGPAIVLGAFISSFFFVWGMGAFDPKMSVHGEHAAEAHPEPADEKPFQILSGYIWQLLFMVTVLTIALMAIAFLPFSPTLIITSDPLASTVGIGYFPITINGVEYQVSELVVFIVFILLIFVSLLVAAGVIGFIFHALSQGVTEAKSEKVTQLGPGFMGDRPGILPKLIFLVVFVVIFYILYQLFYWVLIGLVLATDLALPGIVIPRDTALTLLSFINALILTILILRPRAVVRFVANIAAVVARFLRRVPDAIQ